MKSLKEVYPINFDRLVRIPFVKGFLIDWKSAPPNAPEKPRNLPGDKPPSRNIQTLHFWTLKLSLWRMLWTRHGPEHKNKERPRGGRSHGDTGRDDKIRTCDPRLPNSLCQKLMRHHG